jgi:hypothetical protein
MDIKPPAGEVFTDEHEMRASHFMDQFKAQKEKNPELLIQAANEFQQSSNPEGKDISQMLHAFYLSEKGKLEKDNRKACRYFLKSATEFGKDKRSTMQAQEIMLLFYKRKIDFLHLTGQKPTDIFRKQANVFKKLGKEDQYNIAMSLYYLYLSTDDMRDLKKSISLLETAIEHAKQSGKQDMVVKLEGILHKVKSYASPTLPQAIAEIEEEIKSIEKTSDKYGLETALGDIRFLKSRGETDPEQKIHLLEEAATYYEKSPFSSRAHNIRGDILQYRANKLPAQHKQHADLYKAASEEYAKAGNHRMEKWLSGHYEVALATQLGILAEDNIQFKKHLLEANHQYMEAQNPGGVQFTAGIGLFLEASRAKYPDSVKFLKEAAQCLDSVGEHFLSSFAKSEIFNQESANTKDEKERERLMVEEKNYLERAIIEYAKRQDEQNGIRFPVGGIQIEPSVLGHLNNARLHELNGFLEKNNDLQKEHFIKAKEEYLAVENTGAFETLVLSGIGWSSLFLHDIVDSKKYFERLKEKNPSSPHVKAGLEAIDNLIKVKFSKESVNYQMRKKLSLPMLIPLVDDLMIVKDGKPHPTDFFEICFALIRDAGSNVERYRHDFQGHTEPALRNQLLMLSSGYVSKGLGGSFTGESFTAEGKSDIMAINNEDNKDRFIAECKIWKSRAYYKEGFEQLVGNYLTSQESAGVLITFVKNGDLPKIVNNSMETVKEIDAEAVVHQIDEKNFVSSHKKYGLIFHLFVDLILSKQRVS